MTTLFYFTGTGNSFNAAQEIARDLTDAHLVPMVGCLGQGDIPTLTGKVILVFPVYLLTVPYPVRQFLNTADFSPADYIALVTTGELKGNLCAVAVNRLLAKNNREVEYFQEILMPQNSPTGIKPTKGDERWTEKVSKINTRKILDENKTLYMRIASDIAASKTQKTSRPSVSEFWNPLSAVCQKTTRQPFLISRTTPAPAAEYAKACAPPER